MPLPPAHPPPDIPVRIHVRSLSQQHHPKHLPPEESLPLPQTMAPKRATANAEGATARKRPASSQTTKQLLGNISGAPDADAVELSPASVEAIAIFMKAKEAGSAAAVPAMAACAVAMPAEHPEDEGEENEKQEGEQEEQEEKEAPEEMTEKAVAGREEEVSKAGASDMRAAPKERAQPRANIPDNKELLPKYRKGPHDLYSAIAQETNIKMINVERVLEGLIKVGAKLLKKGQVLRVPHMVRIKIKTVPARAQLTKTIFGKEKILRAKPATEKLLSSTMKQFKKQAMSC